MTSVTESLRSLKLKPSFRKTWVSQYISQVEDGTGQDNIDRVRVGFLFWRAFYCPCPCPWPCLRCLFCDSTPMPYAYFLPTRTLTFLFGQRTNRVHCMKTDSLLLNKNEVPTQTINIGQSLDILQQPQQAESALMVKYACCCLSFPICLHIAEQEIRGVVWLQGIRCHAMPCYSRRECVYFGQLVGMEGIGK